MNREHSKDEAGSCGSVTAKIPHTPSEWMREGLTVYALDERGMNNRFSCRVDGGYEIKTGFQARATMYAELEANARLMASAPDLLAALEWLHLGKGTPIDPAAIIASARGEP